MSGNALKLVHYGQSPEKISQDTRVFERDFFFSQPSPDRRCSLCSLTYNCEQEARLSAQTLTSYVLKTWKLWLVGTTTLEAFLCLTITQFPYSLLLSAQPTQRAYR